MRSTIIISAILLCLATSAFGLKEQRPIDIVSYWSFWNINSKKNFSPTTMTPSILDALNSLAKI
jgi:hypothetical protein